MAKDPIKKAYSRARKKWPGLEITSDRFEAYAREKHREANHAKKVIKTENMALEDLYLALAISDRNPLALDLFYREYGNYIRNVIIRAVRYEDTEDVLQQFVSEIPGRIRKYRGTGSLYGWLGVVAPSFARDSLRKLRHTDELGEDIPSPDQPDDDKFDIRECNELFRDIFPAAIRGLKKPEWQLIAGCKCDGLTNRETAKVAGTHETYISKVLNKKILPGMRKNLLNLARKRPGGRDALYECLKLIGHLDFWEQ